MAQLRLDPVETSDVSLLLAAELSHIWGGSSRIPPYALSMPLYADSELLKDPQAYNRGIGEWEFHDPTSLDA